MSTLHGSHLSKKTPDHFQTPCFPFRSMQQMRTVFWSGANHESLNGPHNTSAQDIIFTWSEKDYHFCRTCLNILICLEYNGESSFIIYISLIRSIPNRVSMSSEPYAGLTTAPAPLFEMCSSRNRLVRGRSHHFV